MNYIDNDICDYYLNYFKLKFNKNSQNQNSIVILGPKRLESLKKENKLEKGNISIKNINKKLIPECKNKNEEIIKITSCKGWRYYILEPYLKTIFTKKTIQNSFLHKRAFIQKQSDDFNILCKNLREVTIIEEIGMKLIVIIRLIKMVNEMSQVDKIILYMENMSIEEIYYWYAKIFYEENQNNGLKALKILILNL